MTQEIPQGNNSPDSAESEMPASTMDTPLEVKPSRGWPIGCYLLVSLIGCFIGSALFASVMFGLSSHWGNVVFCVVPGVGIGLVAFCTTITGLVGRTWLIGLWYACLLVLLGCGLWSLGDATHHYTSMSLHDYYVVYDSGGFLFWEPLCILPFAMTCIGSPLLALRALGGWGLSRGELRPNTPPGVEDLMWGTAVAASLLMLARVPMVVHEVASTDYWLGTAGVILPCAAFFLLVAPLAVRFAFQPWPTQSKRVMVTLGFLAMSMFGLFAVVWIITQSLSGQPLQNIPLENVIQSAGQCSAISLGFGMGLLALQASGFRLVTNKHRREIVHAGVDSDATLVAAQPAAGRKLDRLLAGMILLVACLVSGGVSVLQRSRQTKDQQWAELHQRLQDQGGTMRVEDHQLRELAIYSAAGDAEVAKLLQNKSLERLSLAGSKITNDILLQVASLPKLNSLDLSDTSIDDGGLRHLIGLGRSLRELNLAGTQVTPTGVAKFLAGSSVRTLDISDLAWTLHDLDELPLWRLHSLAVRGLPVTDAWLLEVFSQPTAFNRLDLRDTPVRGDFLASTRLSLTELLLDGTELTNASLMANLAPRTVERLSIDRTQVDDQALPQWLPKIHGLRLGDCQITEDGLALAAPTGLSFLALNHPKYTGAGFRLWLNAGSLNQLDLSDSGVDDQTIQHLRKLQVLSNLSLARTNITDASLDVILDLQVSELDISDTGITAEGLLQQDIGAHPLWRICVAYGQFTAEELAQLRSQISVQEGGNLLDDHY